MNDECEDEVWCFVIAHDEAIRHIEGVVEDGDGFASAYAVHGSGGGEDERSVVWLELADEGFHAFSSRRLAISMYSASRSMPMKPKPSCSAAMPVVPEPTKGSRTVPPGGVTSLHR